jgi:hypothetical protein
LGGTGNVLFGGKQLILSFNGRTPKAARALLGLGSFQFEFFPAMIADESIRHGVSLWLFLRKIPENLKRKQKSRDE